MLVQKLKSHKRSQSELRLKAGAKYDVYFGIALAGKRKYGPNQRVKSDEAASIPGLWVEVDYRSGSTDIHKKDEQLPPTEQAALDLIDELPFKPTIILRSGHGLHVYWLFREGLWQLTTAEILRWQLSGGALEISSARRPYFRLPPFPACSFYLRRPVLTAPFPACSINRRVPEECAHLPNLKSLRKDSQYRSHYFRMLAIQSHSRALSLPLSIPL